MLGGPGVMVATGMTGLLIWGMYYSSWTLPACFMFGLDLKELLLICCHLNLPCFQGSAISATDPVAVVAILRELGVSKRLATLIEAESLLNDGTAFVMFLIFKVFFHTHLCNC